MTTLTRVQSAQEAFERFDAASRRRNIAYANWHALNEDVAAPVSPEWTAWMAASRAAELALDAWLALLPTQDWEDC